MVHSEYSMYDTSNDEQVSNAAIAIDNDNNNNSDDDDDKSSKVWLRIIQINDVYELKNLPHFRTLVDAHSEAPDEVVVLLAGDFLSPSLLSSLDAGRGMVECLNSCGITHVSIGNHETDVSMAELQKRIEHDSDFDWINTNLRDLDETLGVTTLPHAVIEVTSKNHHPTTKRVGLLGLLTDDPSLYTPEAFGGASIESVIPATEAYLSDVIDPLGMDLVVPMTHQRIPEDRAFMKHFGGERFPIILGGHDHEMYDETVRGSRILKTGMDGDHAAIIDVVWEIGSDDFDTDDNGNNRQNSSPEISVAMVRTDSYPPDKQVAKLVESHEKVLEELESARIFRFSDVLPSNDDDKHPVSFSTENNRLGFGHGSTAFATMLRTGMRADCSLINAGNVRGGKTYDNDREWFTHKDLEAEFPYKTGLVVVDLPGGVIEATIDHSRRKARLDPPVAAGSYIHSCDHIVFGQDGRSIATIQGEAFDPDRSYICALPVNW
jgi:2',3'-cyclic-nucleotide 2'-phosphodiesterase (5'-nucleotidase family)